MSVINLKKMVVIVERAIRAVGYRKFKQTSMFATARRAKEK